MIWAGDAATTDVADQAIPLTIEHVDQALKLISLTQPGPFGPRTLELGNYFGYFEEGQLVAMAGERMFAGSFREISGVCTHPRFQARGLARRIVMKLVTRQLGRGETPFLHVVSDNQIARSLYLRMGFQEHRQTVVRVVSR